MSKLIFYSNTNTNGKRDADFAFIPESKAFAKFHQVPPENVVGVNCTLPPAKRRKAVLDKLSKVNDIELLMFFGHGWYSGFQFGWNLTNIEELASAINFRDGMKMGIFACSTAENKIKDNNIDNLDIGTDGGFADKLRDVLNQDFGWDNGWIDGHKTPGHTVNNPYVVRFKSEYNFGGEWIVTPQSKEWSKWIKLLKNTKEELRYKFFTMSKDNILKYLENN